MYVQTINEVQLEEEFVECSNPKCNEKLYEDYECYVHESIGSNTYCSFDCVQTFLLQKGLTKAEIKRMNKNLDIFYTTVCI